MNNSLHYYRQTLSVPRSEKLSKRDGRGKPWASRNRWCSSSNIRSYVLPNGGCCVNYTSNIFAVRGTKSKARRKQLKHERSVGRNTRRSRVFLPTSWVLKRFLSFLQQYRAQLRLLYLICNKESVEFPMHYFQFSKQTLNFIFKANNSVVSIPYTLI